MVLFLEVTICIKRISENWWPTQIFSSNGLLDYNYDMRWLFCKLRKYTLLL